MQKIRWQHTGVSSLLLGLTFLLSACSSLSLQDVDYGWPVESVLKVKDNNTVSEGRYVISFNIAPLAENEFGDPNALKGKEIRLLRNSEGMYYVTGPNFKNVYVLAPEAGELVLHHTFEISETGLSKPALNKRGQYVELLDGNSLRLLFTSDDILEDHDLRAERR